ncbi:hypothetical protein ACOJQI_13345 [Bacillus salacetis]|uniref:hypothetical protein n=1 Tax=Bacillus salacetis TaxID=2315464 RepID=UPI003B9EFE1C
MDRGGHKIQEGVAIPAESGHHRGWKGRQSRNSGRIGTAQGLEGETESQYRPNRDSTGVGRGDRVAIPAESGQHRDWKGRQSRNTGRIGTAQGLEGETESQFRPNRDSTGIRRGDRVAIPIESEQHKS